jgi:hypothetical protein
MHSETKWARVSVELVLRPTPKLIPVDFLRALRASVVNPILISDNADRNGCCVLR